MTTITGIEKGLIERVKKLSLIDEIIRTTFVDIHTQTTEIKITKKIFGIETTYTISVNPEFKSARLIYKDTGINNLIITDELNYDTLLPNKKLCEYISQRINREFLEYLSHKAGNDTIRWKWAYRSALTRLLLGRNRDTLVKKIIEVGSKWDWVIVPLQIIGDISSSKYFIPESGNDCCGVTHVGWIKLDNFSIKVYTGYPKDDRKIYFGNIDSINLILRDKIRVKRIKGDTGSFSVELDYSFMSSGPVSIIEL